MKILMKYIFSLYYDEKYLEDNKDEKFINDKIEKAFAQLKQSVEDPKIYGQELLNPAVLGGLQSPKDLQQQDDPLSVKISRNLFLDAQYCSNKLQSVNLTGKSYLFADSRAGVIIADRGNDGGSKYRHIIQEHERLRRVRTA